MDRENDQRYEELLNINKMVEKKAYKIETMMQRIDYLYEFMKQIDELSSEVDEVAFDDKNKAYYPALNKAGGFLFSVWQAARREQHSLIVKYNEAIQNFDAFLKRFGVKYPYNQGYTV